MKLESTRNDSRKVVRPLPHTSDDDLNSKSIKKRPDQSSTSSSLSLLPLNLSANNVTADSETYLRLYERVLSRDGNQSALKLLHQSINEVLLDTPQAGCRLLSGDSLSGDSLSGDTDVKVLISSLCVAEVECFPDLLTSLCMKKARWVSRQMDLALLQLLLSTNGLHIRDIINGTLPLGDSPIIQAARSCNYDVMWLLLRHGADVGQGWLEFESTLEVLLFSPTQRHTSEEELANIQRCVTLTLTCMDRVNLNRFEQLKVTSYHPRHPDWINVLLRAKSQAWSASNCPPTLKHLSRCSIRRSLSANTPHKLTNKIQALPLPSLIKDYISLYEHRPIELFDCDS